MIKIDINLVFTIINLIVLYLLMKKFLFGPIIAVMEKRKAMIDEQFASAEKTTAEANQLKGQYEDALKSAKEESFSIVEQAKDEAKVQADSIVKYCIFKFIIYFVTFIYLWNSRVCCDSRIKKSQQN